jgi:predicted ATPase/DNA-binding SARP family transcriptional activator/Tfp pilus assembly protein PilF
VLEARIRIECLGHLCIRQGNRSITRFRTYKTGVLLAYLAVHGERAHPREELIEMLWPECDPLLGRNSLSQSLSSLRHQLEPPGVVAGEVLLTDRFSVRLVSEAYVSDVTEFEEGCRRFLRAEREAELSSTFEAITHLYRGEFLPGFYEDWNLRERDRLADLFVQVLLKRSVQFEAQNDLDTAIGTMRRALEVDSLNEDMHLRLMRLYAANHDRTNALRQYADLTRTLKTELGLSPSAEARGLADRLGTDIGVSHRPSPSTGPPASVLEKPDPVLPPGIVAVLAIETEVRDEKIIKLIRGLGGQMIESGTTVISAIFGRVSEALLCAVRIQRIFDKEIRSGKVCLSPGIALHADEINTRGKSKAQGSVRHALARTLTLLGCSHPGQILCSEAASALLLRSIDPSVHLQDLGSYRLSGDSTERIFQADPAGRASTVFPPLQAEPASSSNLPVSLSRFFGRESEIDLLASWLNSPTDGRIITITGPGGTGKTRLSLEVARNFQDTCPNAIWFVPLASIREPSFMPRAILESMQLQPPSAAEPLNYLATVLSRGRSLLVLDNFEHWLPETSPEVPEEARTIVRTLLEKVPDVQCLVTSRRPLGLLGERVFALEPLRVPDVRRDIEDVNRSESVRLFVDRAQMVQPSFQLTQSNAEAIADICCQLEGLPLALELAAAQVQIFTPAQIRKNLEDRLEFLKDRRNRHEARHQHLRAAIDWSFRMLSAETQEFFAALSIFRGGNLSDVEIVCGEPLALDHLAILQDFSFLRIEENPVAEDMRFRILETLRAFGEEKLSSERSRKLRESHARRYLEIAETSTLRLKGEEQAALLKRLQQEHLNFLSALDWCMEAGDAETGLRLAIALTPFWNIRGHVPLGRERLDTMLDLAARDHISDELFARVWSSAGQLALARSEFSTAREYHEKALHIFKKLNDVLGQAGALNELGRVAFEQGDYDNAQLAVDESLKLWAGLGDDHGMASSLSTFGLIASEKGQFASAITNYEVSLDLRRKLGDQRGIASQLNNLGVVYRRQGDYPTAREALTKSLAIHHELENSRSVAHGLSNMSLIALQEGDLGSARRLQEDSLSIRREIDDDRGIAVSLMVLGEIAYCEDDIAAAQKLIEESVSINRRLDNRLGTAQSLHRLGLLYADSGAAEKARKSLAESLAISSALDSAEWLSELWRAYSRFALVVGKPETSAKLFFFAESLKSSGTSPTEQKFSAKLLAELKSSLSKNDFDRARDKGRKLLPSEADDLAASL